MMDWTTSPDQMWPDRLELPAPSVEQQEAAGLPGGFCMQHMICHPGFGGH
jgi:hypothetical protein